MGQRESDHYGRDQARERLISPEVGRRPHRHQNSHDGANLDISHQGQVNQRGDAAPTQPALNFTHFSVQRCPLPFLCVRQRHAEHRQPLSAAAHRVRKPRHILVLYSPQRMHSSPVEGRPGPSQQDFTVALGPVKIAAQIFAVRHLQVQRKRQLVAGIPMLLSEKTETDLEESKGSLVSGRSFSLPSSLEVEFCHTESLGLIDDQWAPQVQVVDEVEESLLGRGGVPPVPHQAPHVQVDLVFALVRNQAVGCLLHPIVPERVSG